MRQSGAVDKEARSGLVLLLGVQASNLRREVCKVFGISGDRFLEEIDHLFSSGYGPSRCARSHDKDDWAGVLIQTGATNTMLQL